MRARRSLIKLAAASVLLLAAACGIQVDVEQSAETAPSPEPGVAASEPASSDETEAPSQPEPEPDTSVPTASVPSASVPTASIPDTAEAPATAEVAGTAEEPATTTSAPAVTVTTVAAPVVAVVTTSVPSASVPAVSVPAVSVPSVSLPVAVEREAGYDRDDWGPHNSGLCRGAVGTPDPYTGTPIDTCNVDHVVALHEAHESGGWAWPGDQKQRFSRDPDNHVASRACVNQSKGGDDISEWSDSDIASSSACGGGYSVIPAGRCLLARITVSVKSEWGLSVDQSEADALGRTLAGCGDQTPGFSAEPQAAAPTAPTTTAAPLDRCVIGGRTAAQYDAVSGIGEVLSGRLVAAQPFSSRTDLEAVGGIGPVKAEAVWSHFCGS